MKLCIINGNYLEFNICSKSKDVERFSFIIPKVIYLEYRKLLDNTNQKIPFLKILI